MIPTSDSYRPFPTVRSPDALISFEVIPKALIKEDITASTEFPAKMGNIQRTVNGVGKLAAKYVTLERYGWKLDGSYSLIPASGAETGYWSEEVSGGDGAFDDPIKFRYEWDAPVDTFGWTFHFDAPAEIRASQVRAEWFDANGDSLGTVEGHTEGCNRRMHMRVRVGINAVQDLHYEDYPWAGGTNANLYDKTTGVSALYYNSSSSLIRTATNGRSVIFPCEPNTTYTVSKQAGVRFSVCYTKIAPANNVNAYGGIEDNTGWSLTITTGADAAYLVVYVWLGGTDTCTLDEMLDTVQIEKGDHATVYVPYANVCPITGWDAATVNWRGGNIFTEEGAPEGYAIDTSGDIVETQGWLVTDYIDVSAYAGVVAHEYKGEPPWVTTNLRVNLYNSGKTKVGTVAGTTSTAGDEYQDHYFDTDGAAYIRFSCPQGFGDRSTLEIAREVVTDWSSVAGPVYGGTADVANGILTVDRVCVTYDGSSDEQWSMLGSSSASAYAMKISPPGIRQESNVITAWANYLRSISNNATWGNYDAFIAVNVSKNVVTGIKSITTVDAWRAYLAQNPLQVMYELETPQTYRITPSDIWTTLEGGSASADCGPCTVEYVPEDDTVITYDKNGGWSLQQFAQDYTAVEFTFFGTNEQFRMLRLVEVDFGISRQYSADSVTDMRIVYGTSIDASAFPAKELTFTFDNSDGEFNILSPAGVYQYWRNGQVLRARVKIGGEVVNMGMFTESTAEIGKNRLLVKVRAHDQVYHMERQKYYPDQTILSQQSITLKTAVEDVLAGYDLKINYNGLQNELVSLRVNENHPKRAIIRYLAQAARAAVWIDRNNTLQFKRFVQPTAAGSVSEITADELYDWSGVSIAEEFSGCVLTVERELEETESGVGTSYTYTSGESEDTGTNTASYENPCIAPGQEQAVCDWLLTAANWRKKYAVKNRCDPAVEIGDALVIEDAFHNDDAAIVTGLDVTFDGVLSCVTEAAGVIG